MDDEFAPSMDPTPIVGREINPENIFVIIFDTIADALLRLPSFIYNLPWDLKGFLLKDKLAPLIEQLDMAASKPQVLGLTLMVIMSLSLVFKPNGGKNKADPNGTAVRFTATLPGDETAWRSKHARRVIVPSPKFCKQMQLFVLAKQKQVEASIAKAAEVATKKRGGLSASAAMQSKGKDAQLLENLLALDVWTRQSVSVRKMIAKKCTADLMHAVSDYIGNDPPLLLAICPELREEKICDDGALARLVTECRRKDMSKVGMPTSVAFGEVQSAIKGHTRTIKTKSDRDLVESFMVSFRSLSILTFVLRCVDESSGHSVSVGSTLSGMFQSSAVAVGLTALVFVCAGLVI